MPLRDCISESAALVLVHALGCRLPDDHLALAVTDGVGDLAAVFIGRGRPDIAAMTLAAPMALQNQHWGLPPISSVVEHINNLARMFAPQDPKRASDWIYRAAMVIGDETAKWACLELAEHLERQRVLSKADIERILAPWNNHWNSLGSDAPAASPVANLEIVRDEIEVPS